MNFPRFEACAAQVNLPLFNAAIHLAIATTDAAKQLPAFTAQMNDMLWYERPDDAGLFETNGIRYFGELLERFAEKLGDTPANLRAVALALAWADSILADGMFVGQQRENFLKTVQNAARTDVYLTAALYRLAREDSVRSALRDRLLQWKYGRTEEILFALCALEDCADTFSLLRLQLVKLLGKGRTIPVEGNTGLLSWFLSRYRADILACRKKDNAGLRALVRLTQAYVRPTDRAWEVLREAGYLPLDILTVNAMFVWDRRCTDLSPDSIPTEKLATAYVVETLNQDHLPSPLALDFISQLLKSYRRFDVRYEGNPGLWEAVSLQLRIICPEILAWMVRAELQYDYRVDVLDAKWDVLPALLSPEKYHELFRRQLVDAPDANRQTVLQLLNKYRLLTGTDYTDAFHAYDYCERDAFNLLTSLNIVDLWQFFQDHKDDVPNESRSTPMHYLWDVVANVHTPFAFAFWHNFFEAYTPADVPRFWPDRKFHEPYIRFYSYAPTLDYLRPALSREENRLLYEWIDWSVFMLDTRKYSAFVLAFLQTDATRTLFDLGELRPIFDQLLLAEPQNSAVRNLKRSYLSEAELADERAAQERAEQERRKAEREKIICEVHETLSQRYDGSFRSLYEALKSLRTWDHRREYAAQILGRRLPEITQGHAPVSALDFGYLLSLCGRLVGYDAVDVPTALAAVQSVPCIDEKEEETANADA